MLRAWSFVVLAACRIGFDEVPPPPEPVDLTVVIDGDGCGRVTVEPMEPQPDGAAIDCPGVCRLTLEPGTQVTVAATPCDRSSTLQGVTGMPCGTAPCTFTVDATTTLVARFQSPRNIAFLSRGTLMPGATSIGQADALCASEAMSAGLTGKFIAWLATGQVPMGPRIGTARGWIRPDGLPVADDLIASTTSGFFHYPITLHADGIQVADPDTTVLTGTTAAGIATANCNNFTSGDATLVFGRPGAITARFTEASIPLMVCNSPMPIYCIGLGTTRTIDQLAFPGKLAFVSSALVSGGGLGAANARCAAEGAATGRSSPFSALLATTTAQAIAAFPASGPGWVDARGHLVFASAGALATATPFAPIAYGALGEPRDTSVWTGAAGPVAGQGTSTRDRTCMDWTSTADVDLANTGLAGDALGYWSTTASACNLPNVSVYCLEL